MTTGDFWGTPDSVFLPLHEEFGFTLDAAANQSNHKLPRWLGPGGLSEDALTSYWPEFGYTVWCNPPYSRKLLPLFVAKAERARDHGVTTVMLLPAKTDTRVFHDFIWDREGHKPQISVEVRFLKGRIKFVGATVGAKFPSMVVVFRP